MLYTATHAVVSTHSVHIRSHKYTIVPVFERATQAGEQRSMRSPSVGGCPGGCLKDILFGHPRPSDNPETIPQLQLLDILGRPTRSPGTSAGQDVSWRSEIVGRVGSAYTLVHTVAHPPRPDHMSLKLSSSAVLSFKGVRVANRVPVYLDT